MLVIMTAIPQMLQLTIKFIDYGCDLNTIWWPVTVLYKDIC